MKNARYLRNDIIADVDTLVSELEEALDHIVVLEGEIRDLKDKINELEEMAEDDK